jgi:cytoskeletal protein RodZ
MPAAAQQEAPVAVSADTIAPGPSPEAPTAQADAGKDAGEGTSASHTAPVQTAPTDGATPVSPLRATAPDTAPAPGSPGKTDGGEVEFLAVKASWILYTVDGGREERAYIKPGKPHKIVFTQKLSVRLGSPSEVTYRFGGRETTVEVGKKESRTLEFP